MTNHSGPPDYDLPDTLELAEPAQYRALFEETRKEIVALLRERAATTSELAAALDKPKGTVGHHLKVLQEAGLVRVVRTERVRALEAKYYGRTARTFLYHFVHEAAGEPQRVLSTAAAEIAAAVPPPEGAPGHELPVNVNARHRRIPAERAEEWARRLNELLIEFTEETGDADDPAYALVVGLYPTRRPALPPTAPEAGGSGDGGSGRDGGSGDGSGGPGGSGAGDGAGADGGEAR